MLPKRILTRRPLQAPAAKHVHVQMLNALAALFSRVDNEPETLFAKSFVSCDLLGDLRHIGHGIAVGFEYGIKMRFGDYQNMSW